MNLQDLSESMNFKKLSIFNPLVRAGVPVRERQELAFDA